LLSGEKYYFLITFVDIDIFLMCNTALKTCSTIS